VLVLLACSAALTSCKNKCCEFVCEEDNVFRCQTEKVHDKAECKQVVKEICGEAAADEQISCAELSDGGVACDFPVTGVPWDLYDDEGAACTGAEWTDHWCGNQAGE
jgi:hypothetical protein